MYQHIKVINSMSLYFVCFIVVAVKMCHCWQKYSVLLKKNPKSYALLGQYFILKELMQTTPKTQKVVLNESLVPCKLIQ